MKSLNKYILENFDINEAKINEGKIPTQKSLENLVKYVDDLQLECDGTSRVISYELALLDIPHTCFVGSVEHKKDGIPYHLWITVGDLIIDYRLRMWLGDDRKIPHGVFKNTQKEVKYLNSKKIELDPKIGRMLKQTSS